MLPILWWDSCPSDTRSEYFSLKLDSLLIFSLTCSSSVIPSGWSVTWMRFYCGLLSCALPPAGAGCAGCPAEPGHGSLHTSVQCTGGPTGPTQCGEALRCEPTISASAHLTHHIYNSELPTPGSCFFCSESNTTRWTIRCSEVLHLVTTLLHQWTICSKSTPLWFGLFRHFDPFIDIPNSSYGVDNVETMSQNWCHVDRGLVALEYLLEIHGNRLAGYFGLRGSWLSNPTISEQHQWHLKYQTKLEANRRRFIYHPPPSVAS